MEEDKDLRVEEWVFRGEGNRNIVFANTREGMVYRLLKSKVPDIADKSTDNEVAKQHAEAHKTLLNNETFVNNIIRSRLHFVPPMCMYKCNLNKLNKDTSLLHGHDFAWELVELPDNLVRHMNGLMQSKKSGHSSNESYHISSPYALRIPDLCIFQSSATDTKPTFCIELKPKCVIKHAVDMPVCRCCLQQLIKVRDGKLSEMSEYCPTDLFSGNKERMTRALSSLLKNPQHNFRIFKDGDLIYDDSSGCFPTNELNGHFGDTSSLHVEDSLVDILSKVLTYVDCDKNNSGCQSGDNSGQKVNLTCQRALCDNPCDDELPHGCILSDLLNGIFYYGLPDIRSVHRQYKKLKRHLQEHPQDRNDLAPEGPFTNDWDSIPDGVDESTLQYAAAKVRQYTIFSTLRVCAMMITLRPLTQKEALASSEKVISDDYGNYFEFVCGFIDFDPKPPTKIDLEYRLWKQFFKSKSGLEIANLLKQKGDS